MEYQFTPAYVTPETESNIAEERKYTLQASGTYKSACKNLIGKVVHLFDAKGAFKEYSPTERKQMSEGLADAAFSSLSQNY